MTEIERIGSIGGMNNIYTVRLSSLLKKKKFSIPEKAVYQMSLTLIGKAQTDMNLTSLSFSYDTSHMIRVLIIYLSMIHPLNCMFSGHLLQKAISN